MIRITYYLRRKPEMTRDAFQVYWRDTHGPLVASVVSDLNILRYVQVHTLTDELNAAMAAVRDGNMEPEYDGVAELWWETEAILNEAMASDAGQRAGALLLEDEARFIDLPESPIYTSYEYPQVNPSPENIVAGEKSSIVKLQFPLRHLKSLDEAAARKYWLTQHGPIIRSHAPASGLLRYVQVHRAADHPLTDALRESRGTKVESYLGHAEVWIDRSRGRTPEGSAAGRAAVADERNFIDFERSTIFAAKERVFIDRR